jgi:hypothetical protein
VADTHDTLEINRSRFVTPRADASYSNPRSSISSTVSAGCGVDTALPPRTSRARNESISPFGGFSGMIGHRRQGASVTYTDCIYSIARRLARQADPAQPPPHARGKKAAVYQWLAAACEIAWRVPRNHHAAPPSAPTFVEPYGVRPVTARW